MLDFAASPFSQKSSGRAVPRDRVERHIPASIATLRIQLARYLIPSFPLALSAARFVYKIVVLGSRGGVCEGFCPMTKNCFPNIGQAAGMARYSRNAQIGYQRPCDIV